MIAFHTKNTALLLDQSSRSTNLAQQKKSIDDLVSIRDLRRWGVSFIYRYKRDCMAIDTSTSMISDRLTVVILSHGEPRNNWLLKILNSSVTQDFHQIQKKAKFVIKPHEF